MKFLAASVLGLSALYGCASQDVAESESRRIAEASRIYVLKGIQYMENGQMDVALGDLKHALALDDGNVSAHNALAVLYDRTGQLSESEMQFRKALELDAADPATLNNYGRFLCRQGQYTRAQDCFDKARRNSLYATPWIVLTNAGVCEHMAGNAMQAEARLREALMLNSGFSPALLEMASIKLDEGRFLEARGFFQRYESSILPTADALWIAVRIEAGLNDRVARDAYLYDLLNRFPDSREAKMAVK